MVLAGVMAVSGLLTGCGSMASTATTDSGSATGEPEDFAKAADSFITK